MRLLSTFAASLSLLLQIAPAHATALNRDSSSMLDQVIREYGANHSSISIQQQNGRLFTARFISRSGNQVSCVNTYGVELVCCEIYPNGDSGNYVSAVPRY